MVRSETSGRTLPQWFFHAYSKMFYQRRMSTYLPPSHDLTSILCKDQKYVATLYHGIEFYLSECSIWRLSVAIFLTVHSLHSNDIETFCVCEMKYRVPLWKYPVCFLNEWRFDHYISLILKQVHFVINVTVHIN